MTDQPVPLAYSIKDAVRVSSIGRTKLFGLIRDNRLKVSKVGNRTLICATSLRKLVDSGA